VKSSQEVDSSTKSKASKNGKDSSKKGKASQNCKAALSLTEKVVIWLDKRYKKSECPVFLLSTNEKSSFDQFSEWLLKAKGFLDSFSSERVVLHTSKELLYVYEPAEGVPDHHISFSCEVSEGNLIQLFGEQWLQDCIVEIFLNIIALEFCEFFVVHTHFMQSLSGDHTIFTSNDIPEEIPVERVKRHCSKLREKIRQHELSRATAVKYLLFPINISNIHWAIGIAVIQERKVYIYDSLGSIYAEQTTLCKKHLQFVLTELFSDDEDEASTWNSTSNSKSVSQPDFSEPKQTKGGSCGVFICTFAEVFMRKRTFEQVKFWNIANIRYLRLRMLNMLLEYCNKNRS
jgi:Ulp1 family protease